jgi:pfkB family carbohydrate kinase
MARLGMDVAVLAKLGSDERADTILRHLKQDGVSTRVGRRDPRLPTGASVLISSHDRNAASLHFEVRTRCQTEVFIEVLRNILIRLIIFSAGRFGYWTRFGSRPSRLNAAS